MRLTKLTLVLLCSGLSLSCAVAGKAEELIGKVSAKVDQLSPVVTQAVDTAKSALAAAEQAKAQAQAAADKAFADLAVKGAPLDSAASLAKWAVQNPVEAGGSGTALLTALAALAVGYKRKKEEADKKGDALAVVTQAVESLDANAKNTLKDLVKSNGGDHPDIKAAIAEAKAS